MKVCVIGSGIIGATTALILSRRGHDVSLFDREGIACGASGGNAGAFAFSDVIPLATPGIMRKVPRWLLDPLGPLSVRPAYGIRIAPWLLQFWRASRRDRYVDALNAQVALMNLSRKTLDAQVRAFNLEALLRREGQLQLYDSEATFIASLPGWQVRSDAGVRHIQLTTPGALGEVQPGLSPSFSHGVFTPDWINVTDPAVWTRHIAQKAIGLGARFETRAVTGLRPAEGGVTLDTPAGAFSFDKVVVAAGAWSRALIDPLGLRIPLETERGYNTTFESPGFDLRTHLTFADHAFVVTRIGEAIRVGGAVELGGLKAAPNMARAERMLSKACRFLPSLTVREGRQWMGFRPSMPDSLPVMGAHPQSPHIILAFGHGHLGLTQSAGTADLVADLVDDRTPQIDLSPFSPTRFGGRAT